MSATLGIGSVVFQCLLYALLGAFLFWLHRRLPLRSVSWLGTYLLLTMPPLYWLNLFLVNHFFNSPSRANSVSNIYTMIYSGSNFLSSIVKLMLAILVLSDLVFVLQKAGIEADTKFTRRLLLAREFSTSIGITILALTVAIQMALLLFRLL